MLTHDRPEPERNKYFTDLLTNSLTDATQTFFGWSQTEILYFTEKGPELPENPGLHVTRPRLLSLWQNFSVGLLVLIKL